MRLVRIPNYNEYRLNLMFNCYKWDPQFFDSNTIAKYALVITENEHEELKRLTENIDKETRCAEDFLNYNLKFAKKLKLPRKIKKEIRSMKNYQKGKNIRLMRYDFHPTIDGKWAVSEVNSDVPGGYAESSLMPKLAIEMINNNYYTYINFLENLTNEISNKVKKNGKIMLVHCTSYSDDRQVMQCLGDKLSDMGFEVIYCAADHINFKNNIAFSILDGNEGNIDAIFRFTPIEWLIDMKPKKWQGYFNTTTVSCNHPIALFAQTKRFPLVWDILEEQGLDFSTWRALHPETEEVKRVRDMSEYIYKPANRKSWRKNFYKRSM